ncbi:MAG TPA: C2H2 type zinc finger domain-containing protein [Acidimicrobiales bacterium]|nr:C2H2 type zinc finger domain-containing protein [Acidimicrobiales bacterium]
MTRALRSVGREDGDVVCEVCGARADGFAALAAHLVDEAARSDVAHVMWLNRCVTKRRVPVTDLEALLRARASGAAPGEARVQR